MKDYFVLAFKNLKHRGIRSWLTLLGIFIGIMAVVSLISLGNGLKMAVNSQFGVSSTELLTIEAGGVSGYGPPGSGAVEDLTKDDAEAIDKLSIIDIATGRLLTTNKMEFNGLTQITLAASIPYGEAKDLVYDAIEADAEYGRLLTDSDDKKVFLGWNFYDEDNFYGKSIKPGNKVIIDGEKYLVVGILEKKGSVIFDNIVYMNEDPLRKLVGEDESVNVIIAKVKKGENMTRAKEEVEKLMRKRRDVDVGEEDFDVSTPEASLKTVNDVLNGIQAFIVIVASISILIGVLGIVNTMTTSVLERQKEIGIMKAVGAKNSQVFLQFFIEAGLMGLVGGLIGVIFGTLIAFVGTVGIANFIGSDITFSPDFMLIGFTLAGSFIVGALAGTAPAINASRQNPVEVLRG